MGDKNIAIIEKMIGYVDKIIHYVSCLDKADFLVNPQLVDACVFNLLQIGELSGRIDESIKSTFSDVPWYKLRGLRNRLVHDYNGINIGLIWDIIKNDLDDLRDQLVKVKNVRT